MNKIQTCKKNKQQQLQISKSSLLSSVSLEAVELQNVIYKYYLRIGVRVCVFVCDYCDLEFCRLLSK